ncbi:MAG: arsenate reductase (glutaredoxin) [Pseudomonadota bacterium]
MTVSIWHNPRCSKSRATLALLEERGITPDVRLYLIEPPNADELRAVLAILGIGPHDLVRRGEAAYKAAGLNKSSPDDAVIAAMLAEPKLIERPIVFAGGKARIGRPPEAVLEII